MIARLQVLLPYVFIIPADQALPSYEWELAGRQVRVYAPYKSQVDRSMLEPYSPEPLTWLPERLAPAEPQPRVPTLRMNGRETVVADTLQIDVRADRLDRRADADEPLVELGFKVANDLLARLRTLARAGHVRPIRVDSTVWRLEYLNDDESELAPQEGLVRARLGASWEANLFGVMPDFWAAVQDLPADFEATPWDTLLLDAVDLLREIGPALVLAVAAIETRIDQALDVLAPLGGLSNDFWTWIKERDRDHQRAPSLGEQLDPLLRGLSGKSLKERNDLWETFKNLYEARNKHVHEGLATIGGKPVTLDAARRLVASTGDIIDWIEDLLPKEHRRPQYKPATEVAVELRGLIQAPKPGEASPPPPVGTSET
jgi:hypothetical protein